MAREKKDAKMLNIKLARHISEELEAFCQNENISKTAAVEKILHKYFGEYKEKDK